MAFRMQASVPDITDLSKEPESTFQLYGPDAKHRAVMLPIVWWLVDLPSAM